MKGSSTWFSKRTALFAPLLAALLFLSLATEAQAYVYKVKPGGTGDGSSWERALGERGFIEVLEKSGHGHEFWLAAGSYRPYIAPDPSADQKGAADEKSPRERSFTLNPGVALFGGFAGNETARSQRDWERNPTILSGFIDLPEGTTANSYSVVVVSGDVGLAATIDGLTITGGRANGAGELSRGGGLRVEAGYTNIFNCFFYDNRGVLGGGLYVREGGPMIRDTRFSDNEGDMGGGAYVEDSRLSMSDCLFSNNLARLGGGLLLSTTEAEEGGQAMQALSPTVIKSVFSGNISQAHGGAIANLRSSPMIKDVSFSANRAFIDGGALFNSECSPQITACTFDSNRSENGGAIANWDSDPVVTNCTFFSNNAASYGGALLNDRSSGIIVNSTFTLNRAAVGGGMFNAECSPIVANSILWRNGGEIRSEGGTITVSCSIVEGGFTGEGNIDEDPRLGALLDNGGFTDTCLPDAESPAIDSGLRVGSRVSGNVIIPAIDQRGMTRPKGAGVDMGACEYSDEPAPTPAPVTGGGGGCNTLPGGMGAVLLLLPLFFSGRNRIKR